MIQVHEQLVALCQRLPQRVTAVIAPLPVPEGFATFDVPVMLAATVFFALMLFFAPKFHRATGAAMLAAYAGYIWALV